MKRLRFSAVATGLGGAWDAALALDRHSLRLFWSFARQSFHLSAVYRFEFWLTVANNLIYMYAIYWLWTTLYTSRALAFGVNLDQMVTYAMLANLLSFVIWPGNRLGFLIARQMKSGEIQMDLLKPLDYPFLQLARNVGQVLFQLVTMALPTTVAAACFLGLRLPAGWSNALWFALSVVLGYLILFSLSFLLGMLAIFTLDIRSISWAYNALVRVLSGQEIPLWLFPAAFQRVTDVLPFKFIYALPLSIYIGKLSAAETLQGLLWQGGWAVVLILAGRLVWRRAYSHLIVQGG